MILITTNNNFMFRSSQRKCQRRCSVKKAVFKKFANFTDLQAFNFIKKRLQHRCFPVKFAKFLRRPILKNSCERMLLIVPQSARDTPVRKTCSKLKMERVEANAQIIQSQQKRDTGKETIR